MIRANDISRLVLEVDSSGVVKATGNLEIFKKKTQETEKSTNRLDDALRGLSPSSLMAVAGVTALVGALKSLVGMGSGVVNMASHFEQVQTQLSTVLQSAEKGARLFEDLRKFSFETTFGVDELASVSQQLVNVGVSTGELQGKLKMLGDLAGGDKNKFAELGSILAKVTAQGRASAIQLQQINLRGIPITKTLQELGVTGVASVTDLTRAFEKLTQEGGQFHDAMNNIIDTIEGKQGFITDTLKEISVNFGSVTGITDAYKDSLDIIYNVLNFVNETLMKVNDNPLMKAITTGAFAAILSGLVTLIGVGLVGALKLIKIQLAQIAGLKAIISSPAGWIIAGVAGITAATAGIVSYVKAQKKLQEQAEKTTQAIQTEINLFNEQNTESDTRLQYEYIKKRIESLSGTKEQLDEEMEDMQKKIDAYIEKHKNKRTKDGVIKGLKDYKKELGFYDTQKNIEALDTMLEEYQKQAEVFASMDQNGKEIQELMDRYSNIFAGTDFGKKQKEIAQITEDIKNLNDLLGKEGTKILGTDEIFKFDDKTRSEIDKTIKYLQDKLDELNGVVKKKKWWEVFFDETGVSGNSGIGIGQNYAKKMFQDYYKELRLQQSLGLADENTEKELSRSFMELIEKQIRNLLDTNEFDVNDNSIQGMIKTLQAFKVVAEGTTVTEKTNPQGKSTKETFIEDLESLFSGGASGLIQLVKGLATGNVEDIYSAILNIISQLTIFQNLMNSANTVFTAFDNILTQLEPVLKVVYEFIMMFADALYMVSSVIELLAALFEPVFRVLRIFVKEMRAVFSTIDNLLQKLSKKFKDSGYFNWLSEEEEKLDDYLKATSRVTSEEEKQAELLKTLNSQYKDLLGAMVTQEEYYYQMQQQFYSDNYKDKVLGVHDMILTPQGKFSTDPDDYIIASKDPSSLGGNTTVVKNQIEIKNEMGESASVNVQEVPSGTDGINKLLVTISRKVADDYSRQVNGWGNAITSQKITRRRMS